MRGVSKFTPKAIWKSITIDDFAVEPKLEEKQMVVRYVNHKGEARCHGGADLKASQSYPRQFPSWNSKG